MAKKGAGRFATTSEQPPGYPTACLGHTRRGAHVDCPTPSFPVQLSGRCVRCHQLHHRAALATVDPWVSTNDLRFPADEMREEREAGSEARAGVPSRKVYRQRGGVPR